MNERTWDSRGAGRGLKQLMEAGQRGTSSEEREGILGQGKSELFLALPLPLPSQRAHAPPRARVSSAARSRLRTSRRPELLPGVQLKSLLLRR